MYWMYVCVYMRTNEFLIRPRFLDFSQGLSLLKCVHFNGKENPLFALDNFSSILHRKSGRIIIVKKILYYVWYYGDCMKSIKKLFNFYSKKNYEERRGG